MSAVRRVINGERFYAIPGQRELFPSVTTVLKIINKPAITQWQQKVMLESVENSLKNKPKHALSASEELKWRKDILQTAKHVPDKLRNEAADLGTRAHAFIDENLLRDKMRDDVPEELRHIVQGFEAWRKNAGLCFVQRDTQVWSTEYKYAGALDALAIRTSTRGLVILDWKTSSLFSHQYAYQIAAYAKALEEMSKKSVEEAWVVRFDKYKPSFEIKKVENLDESFEAFRCALILWNAQNKSPWSVNERHV